MNHYKSVFDNEQELLNALISIHLDGKDIDCDPMFFKGNFYKDGIKRPKYTFDLNPQDELTIQGDSTNLDILDNQLDNIILDPPFLICNRPSQYEYYSSKTHTYFKTFDDLYIMYEGILKEAYRTLRKGGHCIFKCQDYTDSKTTMTHCIVYILATTMGFYAKDLAILVKPNKITNPNTKQRHLRKIHTYFWVLKK